MSRNGRVRAIRNRAHAFDSGSLESNQSQTRKKNYLLVRGDGVKSFSRRKEKEVSRRIVFGDASLENRAKGGI